MSETQKTAPPINYDEASIRPYTLPDALRLADGRVVSSPADWPVRRAEILEMFRGQMFGRSPGRPGRLLFQTVASDGDAMNGAATMRQVSIVCENNGRQHAFPLTLFTPNAAKRRRVPALLFINIRGATHTDLTRSAVSPFWPAERMIERGYAAASFEYGDVAPDKPETFRDGVIGLFENERHAAAAAADRPPSTWAALAAWAWGASRCLDYLETEERVDAKRVSIIGHSRGGKAALWAAAEDERFAAVYSNNSGCGGAALSRRKIGETVRAITTAFPHWFAPAFAKYTDREEEMPFDQHMLLSLVAPRPLYVTSATEDRWADPRGEFLSLAHSSGVFGLWGERPIDESEMPSADLPLVVGRRGYHIRTGKHDLTPWDWDWFMDFLDANRVGSN